LLAALDISHVKENVKLFSVCLSSTPWRNMGWRR